MYVVWFTAMSMDGRIADKANSIDFLQTISDHDAALAEFPEFLASVDAVVVGASTLRWLLDNGHGWPHGDRPTWLVSNEAALVERVGSTEAPFLRASGDLAPMFAQIEEAGHDRVWLCGGGDVAGQALALGRVDEVLATIAPTVIGAGPALFDGPDLGSPTFQVADARVVAGNAVRVRWVVERGG